MNPGKTHMKLRRTLFEEALTRFMYEFFLFRVFSCFDGSNYFDLIEVNLSGVNNEVSVLMNFVRCEF